MKKKKINKNEIENKSVSSSARERGMVFIGNGMRFVTRKVRL